MFFLFLNECFFSLSDCSSIVLVFITIYFLVSMIFVCSFFVTVNDSDRKKTEMELFPKKLTVRLHDFRLIYCSMQYSSVFRPPSNIYDGYFWGKSQQILSGNNFCKKLQLRYLNWFSIRLCFPQNLLAKFLSIIWLFLVIDVFSGQLTRRWNK